MIFGGSLLIASMTQRKKLEQKINLAQENLAGKKTEVV
jgi:hypothetical protein